MFNRDCEAAILTYHNALGMKIVEVQKYGDMPYNPNFIIPDNDKQLILHARLELEGMDIMCADSLQDCFVGNNMYVSYTTKDSTAVLKAWDILKQEGEIYMELAPSFFAVLHGSLKDKYGVNWMFTVLR